MPPLPNCHLCGWEATIRCGKTKAGTQRYKCARCKKVFVEEQQVYTKTEKRLLSMLVELLDMELGEKFDFKDFVERSREKYGQGSGKITIEQTYGSWDFDISKAKIVICKDGSKISVFKVKVDGNIPKTFEAHKQNISLYPVVSKLTREQKKLMRDAEKERMKEEKLQKKIKSVQEWHNKGRAMGRLPDKIKNMHKYKPKDDPTPDDFVSD